MKYQHGQINMDKLKCIGSCQYNVEQKNSSPALIGNKTEDPLTSKKSLYAGLDLIISSLWVLVQYTSITLTKLL